MLDCVGMREECSDSNRSSNHRRCSVVVATVGEVVVGAVAEEGAPNRRYFCFVAVVVDGLLVAKAIAAERIVMMVMTAGAGVEHQR